METATKQYLSTRGYVDGEGKILRSPIIDQLREAVPVIDALEDVEGKAALVIQLRAQILGDSGDEDTDKELNYLVGDLLSVAPKGRVQTALENGYVLCSLRVKRVLEEGTDAVSKSARFISSNPDVVERYASQPAIDRAVKTAARANDVLEMTGRRIPLLASRRPVLAQKGQEQLALALPLDQS